MLTAKVPCLIGVMFIKVHNNITYLYMWVCNPIGRDNSFKNYTGGGSSPLIPTKI